MNDQDKIIAFIRMRGPTLPAQVAKHINSNILLASAHLSELSSQGKVKISRLKIGGSPLYYLPEHREKLQNFIHNLNPKDQETLRLLREKKILKEKNLDLLTRVSLRNIKDFAIPLTLNLNNQKELFWKWYLLDDQQAVQLVKNQLVPSQPQPPPQPQTEPREVKPSLLQPETAQTREYAPERRENDASLNPSPSTFPKQTELKKPLIQKIKEKFKPKRKETPDKFFPQIESFFKERNIKIETKESLRKNSEMNFILEVPSVVGRLTYFCKAKNKKRCDEKDISAAYMETQIKKLPLLFLYTNEISKKAQEMLDSNTFQNLIVKKLD